MITFSFQKGNAGGKLWRSDVKGDGMVWSLMLLGGLRQPAAAEWEGAREVWNGAAGTWRHGH